MFILNSMAKISIRDTSGNILESIDLGTIKKGETSPSFTFRVYNDYEQEGGHGTAYNVRVGVVIFKYSGVHRAFSKPLESHIIKNGIVEIDCTISSKLNGGYPNVDWTPIAIINGVSDYFTGEDFDTIVPDPPNNFNEYKIRLANFPSESYFKGGNYLLFIKVLWDNRGE